VSPEKSDRDDHQQHDDRDCREERRNTLADAGDDATREGAHDAADASNT
jgi:hypothetical protein